MNVFQTASNIGIIPVIAIEDAAKAVPLARALTAGGLPRSPRTAPRSWWARAPC